MIVALLQVGKLAERGIRRLANWNSALRMRLYWHCFYLPCVLMHDQPVVIGSCLYCTSLLLRITH